MVEQNLSMGCRNWSWLAPLISGTLSDPRLSLRIETLPALPGFPSQAPRYDLTEISLGRLAERTQAGQLEADLALPIFVMRDFRHGCILTTRDHPARKAADLEGARIGLTGWRNSGNIWTRAALAACGVDLARIDWVVGPFDTALPHSDVPAAPSRLTVRAASDPLRDMLMAGKLDAVFTAFPEPVLQASQGALRPVMEDVHDQEKSYLAANGYVPGVHCLALRRALVAEHPWLPEALQTLFSAALAAHPLPQSTTPSGLEENRVMIDAFIQAATDQGILTAPITPSQMFG